MYKRQNRDGTLGTGGCIFCSEGGSGDFAERRKTSVTQQIEDAKARVARKISSGKYIAYFQSYTNTYAPVDYLETLFTEAIRHPDVAVLSVATRPDCLPPETVKLLRRLNEEKPVWVELGLQTIRPDTAELIQRGYPLSCFEDAFSRLKDAGLEVVTHVILGLPGESREAVSYTHLDVYKRQARICSRSAVSFSLSSTKLKPKGSSTTPALSERKVPAPCRMVTRLRLTSTLRASRTMFRLTPKSSDSSFSVGSLSPGA